MSMLKINGTSIKDPSSQSWGISNEIKYYYNRENCRRKHRD